MVHFMEKRERTTEFLEMNWQETHPVKISKATIALPTSHCIAYSQNKLDLHFLSVKNASFIQNFGFERKFGDNAKNSVNTIQT